MIRRFASQCVRLNEKAVKMPRILKLDQEHGDSSKAACNAEIPTCQKYDTEKDYSKEILAAAGSLTNGNVISIPTDTIYGIAGLAQNTAAVAKLYQIKGRHSEKPVSICVGNVQEVYKWGKVTISEQLLHELLPGPVTLVFERTLALNPKLNPTTTNVGIRIPDNQFVRQLCKEIKEPVALTSANLCATMSTLSIHEFENIWPSLDIVVDGGILGNTELSRAGSTVVDLSEPGNYFVLRDGSAGDETREKLNRYGLTEIKKS